MSSRPGPVPFLFFILLPWNFAWAVSFDRPSPQAGQDFLKILGPNPNLGQCAVLFDVIKWKEPGRVAPQGAAEGSEGAKSLPKKEPVDFDKLYLWIDFVFETLHRLGESQGPKREGLRAIAQILKLELYLSKQFLGPVTQSTWDAARAAQRYDELSSVRDQDAGRPLLIKQWLQAAAEMDQAILDFEVSQQKLIEWQKHLALQHQELLDGVPEVDRAKVQIHAIPKLGVPTALEIRKLGDELIKNKFRNYLNHADQWPQELRSTIEAQLEELTSRSPNEGNQEINQNISSLLASSVKEDLKLLRRSLQALILDQKKQLQNMVRIHNFAQGSGPEGRPFRVFRDQVTNILDKSIATAQFLKDLVYLVDIDLGDRRRDQEPFNTKVRELLSPRLPVISDLAKALGPEGSTNGRRGLDEHF